MVMKLRIRTQFPRRKKTISRSVGIAWILLVAAGNTREEEEYDGMSASTRGGRFNF